jgi:prolyl-tRNA editing enzyme YbaK/EbsC (Cys-tRNA(Pro) deacylase)
MPGPVSRGAVATRPTRAFEQQFEHSRQYTPPTTKKQRRAAKMGAMSPHPNVQAVQDALDAAGALDGSGQPCQVRLLPDAVHTAAAAATALGIEVGQIANSLIFNADDEPLLVLTSGAHRVDTARVAADLGLVALKRATPEFVRAHTGQPIGGVAPLGHPKPVRTLVDTALSAYPEIWAAGGVPQAVFPTTYAELLRITAGTAADVA